MYDTTRHQLWDARAACIMIYNHFILPITGRVLMFCSYPSCPPCTTYLLVYCTFFVHHCWPEQTNFLLLLSAPDVAFLPVTENDGSRGNRLGQSRCLVF
jgi:hypothetical protein